MDNEEFRRRGREMIDFIIEHNQGIRNYPVTPNVEPGFLYSRMPLSAPEKPEKWDMIMRDTERFLLPGMTHWNHPNFYAYFPIGWSYPSILGEIFDNGTGSINFSWVSGPAATELESIMLDWLVKMFGLPNEFLYVRDGTIGGGVLQNSSSESMLVCLIAARCQALKKLKLSKSSVGDGVFLSTLVAYCSTETHSCCEKAAMIAFVKLRLIETDEHFRMRGETLEKAIRYDRDMGYVPFFVVATLGTSSACAFDPLDEIGKVCQKEKLWFHVDAAYAGAAFVCPEFRHLLNGVEYADSYNFNPYKWMLCTFDTACMWVRDKTKIIESLEVDPTYLKNMFSDKAEDFRHWEIPLGRKFRAVKLWFVIRTYGVSGIRKYIREHVRLAKVFEGLVREDGKFEVINDVIVGLVCFRLKGSNLINEKLLSSINHSRLIHLVPALLKDKYVLRLSINYQYLTEDDIVFAWNTISQIATDLLETAEGLQLKEESTMTKQQLERERNTVVQRNDQQVLESYYRNFFVRVVADPELSSHSVSGCPKALRKNAEK